MCVFILHIFLWSRQKFSHFKLDGAMFSHQHNYNSRLDNCLLSVLNSGSQAQPNTWLNWKNMLDNLEFCS